MNNVPGDILALTGAVITSKAPNALPSSSASAQTTRPPTTCNSLLFQEPACSAVQCNNRRHDHRSNGTEPPSPNDCRSNLPPNVRVSERVDDVRRHGFEPVFVIYWAGRWWRKSIGTSTGFAVQTSTCFGVSGSTSPLFDTEVMDECHRARTFAR